MCGMKNKCEGGIRGVVENDKEKTEVKNRGSREHRVKEREQGT